MKSPMVFGIDTKPELAIMQYVPKACDTMTSGIDKIHETDRDGFQGHSLAAGVARWPEE